MTFWSSKWTPWRVAFFGSNFDFATKPNILS
jgi:hypothetical protein